jgi:hypothetical protein
MLNSNSANRQCNFSSSKPVNLSGSSEILIGALRLTVGEIPAEKCRFSAILQHSPQPRGVAQLQVLDLIEAAEEIFQRAEASNQADGGFFTDAFDAWNIVDRIAHQPHHFDDFCRLDAKFAVHFGGADPAGLWQGPKA